MISPRTFYLSLLILVLITGVYIYRISSTTTLMLVRHAERFDDAANTNLSDEGFARAQALIEASEGVDIAGIYSTNFCRTAQTARPLVIERSLPLNVQQVSASGGFDGCTPPIAVPINVLPARLNTEEAFIDYVLEQHAGETVVIVGHSNTVPALVNELGNGAFEVDELDHQAYDNLFIVSVPGFWGGPVLSRTTYGNSSP